MHWPVRIFTDIRGRQAEAKPGAESGDMFSEGTDNQ